VDADPRDPLEDVDPARDAVALRRSRRGLAIAAGSGALTFGSPDSPGVTKGTAKDTLIAPFNNLSAIEEIISKRPLEESEK
jgi:hypothetical protein